MKRRHISFFCIMTLLSLLATAALATTAFAAEEKGFQVQGANFMLVSLENLAGKKVTLRLTSGEELSGTLHAVGQNGVHLTELQGREFFDALIRIDQIAAVIVKTK